MKKTNFTHLMQKAYNLLLPIVLIMSALNDASAQTPIPGVCRSFRQTFQGPGNRILNPSTNPAVPAVLSVQGTAAPFNTYGGLPAGSNGVIEIAGMFADQPGPAIPANQTIYKVSVSVGINHPRAQELDLVLGYNAPVWTGATWQAASLTPGPQTRWVTLSTDNGGNLNTLFPTFDDDAEQGGLIDFPTPQTNNNFVTARDYANAPSTQRIIPEEPLSQLVGMPATSPQIGANVFGGVFFIAVRDDTPAPAGSINATFDGSLSNFTVTLITIPTQEYGGVYPVGLKYSDLVNQRNGANNAVLPAAGIGVRQSNVFSSTPGDRDSILNNTTITKTLEATGLTGRTLTDVDVRVAFRHTFLGDLAMSLTSPAGTTVTLINRKGGNLDFGPSPAYLAGAAPAQPAVFPVPADQRAPSGHVIYPSLIFSDESDSTAVAGTSMFGSGAAITAQNNNGNFGALSNAELANDNVVTDQDYLNVSTSSYATPFGAGGAVTTRGFFPLTPEEGLGAFIGEAANGTWTLKITDNNGRDVGVLDRFEVRLTTIPKPCVLDFAASGGAGCDQEEGSVNITACSNQFPLDVTFIEVEKKPDHNTIGTQVGTTIQLPIGNTVYSAPTNDVNASNPRVTYTTTTYVMNAANGSSTPVPDPAVNAQNLTVNQITKYPLTFNPQAGRVFGNGATDPRHGVRAVPQVPASQAYCRYPARIPVTVGAPNVLDQNPTDSISMNESNQPPSAVCKDKISVSLDNSSTPGLVEIDPFQIDNNSTDDCTPRPETITVQLGNKLGASATSTCTTLGTYAINFRNSATTDAYAGTSSTCPTVSPTPTTTVNVVNNDVKILGSLANMIGLKPSGYIFTLKGTDIVGTTYTIVTTGAAPLTRLRLSLLNPATNVISTQEITGTTISATEVAFNTTTLPANFTITNVEVLTRLNVTAGALSNISLALNAAPTNPLRFTTMPRTVTCADINKPTKIMLVVKDASNQVDSCYTTVMVMDASKPTITCGTTPAIPLPTVDDCAIYLTAAQMAALAPNATDNCLGSTSLQVPLQKGNSIAPGIAFMLENTTTLPMIIESLNIPVLAPSKMMIRAFIRPENMITVGTQIDQTTPPASGTYPILHQNALAPTTPWRFWGQNILPAQTPGTISEVEFIPKNFSNLTFAVGSNTGIPYTVAGNNNLGAALIIPAGQRYAVYLAAFGVDANGYPVPQANNSTFGIVHSNAATGGITPSYPYPLPTTAAALPPLIVRAGWNTTNPTIGTNEFESPGFPTVANPTVPPFTPQIFTGVVNFPLGYELQGAPVPLSTAGGSVRMFAGTINYVFGESKTYTPPLGNQNTDIRHFIYPVQGPRGTVNYLQKPPLVTLANNNTTLVTGANVNNTFFDYSAIKQISGIDYRTPYPIGKTVNVFQVTDKAGNTATCSQTIEVVPAAGAVPPTLVCNDLVNLSLDETCTDQLNATKFLANSVAAKCLGAFKIEILNGLSVLGSQQTSYSGVPLRTLVGGTYDYKVIDIANTQNFCWGKVKFEDKLAPKVVCPDNITVDDCSADLTTETSLVYTQSYSNPSGFAANFTVANSGVSQATIPVSAPKGAKIISVKVRTNTRIAPNYQISRLNYFLVTPSGGLLQLASQPGLQDDGNTGIVCTNGTTARILSYNFQDNATNAPLVVTSGYACPPPNGTYLPMDELGSNLIGLDPNGDWAIQYQEQAVNNAYTGAGNVSAAAGGLTLEITMSIPVDKAIVQEYCTQNLNAALAESVTIKQCAQDTTISKIIKRTYSAKDAYGNLGTCSHTISFKRAKLANSVYPNDIVLDCSYNNLKSNPTDSAAIANAIAAGASITTSYKGPWFDSNGNPHPNVVGKPRPFTCNSYSVGYTDMRIDDICGSGNGAFAVRRTWKVYDACTNKANEYQQYIAVQDVIAPVVGTIADLTISPKVGECTATVTLPTPTITDNCNAASDMLITYEVFSDQTLLIPAGSPSSKGVNIYENIPTSTVTKDASGNVVESWYYVKYTVTDKCGNITTASGRFKVTDLIAPVAVCPPLIKVSLTQDGTAFVQAQEFDRGSYDNCLGISKYQVWRLDDGDCVTEDVNANGFVNDDVDVDGDGFAEYPEFEYYKHPQDKVKFCCADIGDTIMVMFRVWDYSPIIGRNGFRPMEANYDYGIGNRGNVNICMSRVLVEDKLPPVIYTQDTAVICGTEVLAKDWLDLHKPQPQSTSGLSEVRTSSFTSGGEVSLTNGTVTIPVTVSGLGNTKNADLNVRLNFAHTNVGNLFVNLVSPSGNTVSLFRQPASNIGNIPYTSSGSTPDNAFDITFDDEPGLAATDYVKFTKFDDLGVSGTDVTTNDVSLLNRKYSPATPISLIESGILDGQWKLVIGEIDPDLAGTGAVLAQGVQLDFQALAKTQNVFFSKNEAKIYSNIDSFSTTVVIPVQGIGNIEDVNVGLNMFHTNLGNLQASITSPQGTTVDLFVAPTSENGGAYVSPLINGVPASNMFRLKFNDEPSINPNFLPQFSNVPGVPDTVTPANVGVLNGAYLALGQLSAFDGQNANGNWILTITRLDPTVLDSGAVINGGVRLEITSTRQASSNTSYVFDNCDDYVLACKDVSTINNCGVGKVTRTWTLTDAAGRTATDEQTYTSANQSHYTVLFPEDKTITCDNGSTDTSYAGKPIVTRVSGCPVVATSYKDDILSAVNGACYRIKRTWRVANLCQQGMMRGISNSNTPDAALMITTLPTRLYTNNSEAGTTAGIDTDGYVEYIQIINVNDQTAPTITNAPTSIALEPLAKECKVKITIPAVNATDACSDLFTKSWSLINKATKSVVITKDSFPYAYTFTSSDFGKTFIVRYTVGDRCGNIAIKEVEVTPADIVKPTPICYHGLAVDLNPTTNSAMVMASQFDAGSFDANACTTQPNLTLRIERGTPGFNTYPADANGRVQLPSSITNMLVLDCKGLVPIRLWVTDAAGNSDYCDTYVDVQNNMGATGVSNCPGTTGSRMLIELVTVKTQTIKNADVSVATANGMMKATFDANQYSAIVPSNTDAAVSAEKNDNPLNGVSTYDLVMMTKHLLAVQPISDPYLLRAADVNNNGTITNADIVELRKMILAIQTGFTKNKSWRFYDSAMNEVVSFTNANPYKGQIVKLTGVKTGDINVSADAASQPRTTGTLHFDVNEKVFAAGEEVKATFNAAEIANIEGYQFTLGYDKETLELSNIEGNSDNFGVVENGVITTSWNGEAQSKDNLFTVVFKAKKAGTLSELMTINSKFTNAEAYTKAGEYQNVALKFNGARDKFALYQNQPNPFMGRTIVGFNLPKADHAKMTIYDMGGRLIKTVEGDFSKGYNEVIIDEILGSGVLNYKLETSTETATKSMIILE